MVSKLLLAAQETYFRAVEAGTPKGVLKRLADCYYDIRAGIGDYKTPEVYGAFPMDPYSHTPAQGGARQPGLTGQVKEDSSAASASLALSSSAARFHFRPFLLRPEEFATIPSQFTYYDVAGKQRRLALKPGELAFTYCQVPVIYRLARKNGLSLVSATGATQQSRSSNSTPPPAARSLSVPARSFGFRCISAWLIEAWTTMP